MSIRNDPRAYKVVGCAMKVHEALGNGFLESAYGDALEIEFRSQGVPYVREDEVRVQYNGHPLKTTYRADFTCYDGALIVELKAIKKLGAIEAAQTIHYLRATAATSAVLINFGAESLQYDYFPESFKTSRASTPQTPHTSATQNLRSVSEASVQSGLTTNSHCTESSTNVPATPTQRSVSEASDQSGLTTNSHCTESSTNVPATPTQRSVSEASDQSGLTKNISERNTPYV